MRCFVSKLTAAQREAIASLSASLSATSEPPSGSPGA